MKLNCVVVDDSTIQRITIAKLVNEHPNLVLVGIFLMHLKPETVL
jgi:ABC-type ATPase with predicted acetyltransferase domain